MSNCPLCKLPLDADQDVAEFESRPGTLFHASCVEEHGTDRAHEVADGGIRSHHRRVSALVELVADVHQRVYDPEDSRPVEPVLAELEKGLRDLQRSRPTLIFKFEEDGETGEPFAVVDGIMAGSDRGIYVHEQVAVSVHPERGAEAIYDWVKQGKGFTDSAPDWLAKALDAAWEEWWDRAEQVRAAEAAAGWDARP